MISIIFSSFSTKDSALRIGKLLLDKRLIACSNIIRMESQYVWKGKFHEGEEFGAYFKTSLTKKNEVVRFINQHHPYEIPCITSKDVVINNAYKGWMDSFLMGEI